MTAPFPRIAAFADRWPKLVALLLGAVSATGFAPLGLWPLTLVALAGWMALVARASRGWRAFGIGWAFGVGHFVVGLNWIATAFTYQAAMPAWLGWIAVVLLSLYLAVYPALAAWGAWLVRSLAGPALPLRRAKGAPRSLPFTAITTSYLLSFAGMWILTEWLRAWLFTGFAWNPLAAIALAGNISGILGENYLELIGTYGAGGLVVMWSALIAASIEQYLVLRALKARGIVDPREQDDLRGAPLEDFDNRRFAKVLAVGTGLALLMMVAGIFPSPSRDYPSTPPKGETLEEMVARIKAQQGIPITVVQPNIGQQDKWEGSKADANFAKLARLTSPKDDTPRLILWPEAAVPDYLETGYPPVYYDRSPAEARGRITNLMNPGDVMLLGALKLELDKNGDVVGARNAVMTVHADGTLGPRYDKSHLVPYGEYLPMRPILSAIGLSRLAPGDIDFWPGPGPHTLDLGAFGRAGLQICYEIIFSGQVVDRDHRPDFIFNPSNDAWFGAWGPPQHLAQARLRAIEEGLPVVRATPTGISAVIDADGRILESLPMHTAGRIDTVIPPAHAPTLFARFGNILPVGFALLLLALAIAFRGRGR
ncbi:apolipoprotein N-acyltransferase [Sphingopyxis sp. JAI128]|uniref:apolipoprotein N-acyltransferase n=1 Tax=Sphingopyxis sp. JAI128 TaxID=2723066 RepID=UPI001612472F|nr:apolipoprotein N-acyltransferase [Sphingopyxis sp. JAI128]MBB6427924.1 apolipoprotein N-acyltransferase [Sphingopyxis sp. JAI128]